MISKRRCTQKLDTLGFYLCDFLEKIKLQEQKTDVCLGGDIGTAWGQKVTTEAQHGGSPWGERITLCLDGGGGYRTMCFWSKLMDFSAKKHTFYSM